MISFFPTLYCYDVHNKIVHFSAEAGKRIKVLLNQQFCSLQTPPVISLLPPPPQPSLLPPPPHPSLLHPPPHPSPLSPLQPPGRQERTPIPLAKEDVVPSEQNGVDIKLANGPYVARTSDDIQAAVRTVDRGRLNGDGKSANCEERSIIYDEGSAHCEGESLNFDEESENDDKERPENKIGRTYSEHSEVYDDDIVFETVEYSVTDDRVDEGGDDHEEEIVTEVVWETMDQEQSRYNTSGGGRGKQL